MVTENVPPLHIVATFEAILGRGFTITETGNSVPSIRLEFGAGET